MRAALLCVALISTGCIAPTDPNAPITQRPSSVSCGIREAGPGFDFFADPEADCHLDVECGDGLDGRCLRPPRFGAQTCSYNECRSDEDCPDNGVCLCGEGSAANWCVGGGCRTNADCPGSFCTPTFGICGNFGGIVEYQCRTPEDTCKDDSDCLGTGGYCAFNPSTGTWACAYGQCVG